MKKQIQHGIKAGSIFGIVTIFLFLIGFTNTAADLFGDLFRNKNCRIHPWLNTPDVQSSRLSGFDRAVGWSLRFPYDKDQTNDPWGAALVGGLIAGLVHGLLVGSLALLIGTLNLNGVRISMYLAEVLPDAVKLFLVGKSPLEGAFIQFVLMTLTGLLGGLLSRGVGRGSWRIRSGEVWNGMRNKIPPTTPCQTGKRQSVYSLYCLWDSSYC